MIADVAAHLQRRALPSGRAATQVGQDGPDKNSRQQQNRQALAHADRIDDVVGSLTLRPCQLVKANNEQSRQWQAPQQKDMGLSIFRGPLHAQMKQYAHHAAAKAN
ncbi:hypothetical protein SDC9_103619 [bioreactor metagenome]|uniref:Uncharacterized protein n=1 Tax=bioreactor metagenome TaxID=1076179 RepID=A0A645B508_9ZZZZ